MSNDAVNFIHIRERDAQGRISTHGGFTIAYRQTAPDEVVLATAMCNEKDNFCRRIGRAIAGGRLAKNIISDSIEIDATKPLSKKELYQRVMEHLRSGQ
jgi:glycerol-3-phosphate dehydrogenase